MADAEHTRQPASTDVESVLPLLPVWVVYSDGPRQWQELALTLVAGATVADALRAAGLPCPAEGDHHSLRDAWVGVWNRKASLQRRLQPGDRVECYRPLRVDPKVARAERFRQQGARSAGLFARRRTGAKAGY